MLFKHRGFSIECSVEVVGPDYAGQAVISRLVTDESGSSILKKYEAILNKSGAIVGKNTLFLDSAHIRIGEALNHFLHALSDELAGRRASRINGHD
jgi:hypothetical protein